MSSQFKIELTPQAQKVLSGMQSLPARLVAAIARGMDQANQIAIRNIKTDRLVGEAGPFPIEEHKLGKVSGLLRHSVWASQAQATSGGQIQSAAGSPVGYAAIHEFGGRIHHKARPVKVRHKLDARGNLVKQLANSNLLMFAKAGAKRARTTTVQGKAYDVDMPERAPFRTGLEETRDTYKTMISRAILDAWQKTSI